MDSGGATLTTLLARRAATGHERERERREAMVCEQIAARGAAGPRVLEAMRAVPRHLFVPAALSDVAYGDHPLPIGHGQTISQPYIVAMMTELLEPGPEHVVLEIGTGSGYQAAVLARLVRQVYSVEIVAPLAETSRKLLSDLGYDNVTVVTGDGHRGYPDEAPFDGIIVTAAAERVPQPLLDQLRVGGKLVIPVGDRFQELQVIARTGSGYDTRSVLPVRFVPMRRGSSERPPGA